MAGVLGWAGRPGLTALRNGTAVVAPPVAAVEDQTLEFGALTPADFTGLEAAAADLSATYAFATLDSVVSGDGTGWEIASGRLRRTGATPASSAGAVLRCTVTTPSGPVQIDVTIAATARTVVCATQAELAAAAARTDITTGGDGAILLAPSETRYDLTAIDVPASATAANSGGELRIASLYPETRPRTQWWRKRPLSAGAVIWSSVGPAVWDPSGGVNFFLTDLAVDVDFNRDISAYNAAGLIIPTSTWVGGLRFCRISGGFDRFGTGDGYENVFSFNSAKNSEFTLTDNYITGTGGMIANLFDIKCNIERNEFTQFGRDFIYLSSDLTSRYTRPVLERTKIIRDNLIHSPLRDAGYVQMFGTSARWGRSTALVGAAASATWTVAISSRYSSGAARCFGLGPDGSESILIERVTSPVDGVRALVRETGGTTIFDETIELVGSRRLNSHLILSGDGTTIRMALVRENGLGGIGQESVASAAATAQVNLAAAPVYFASAGLGNVSRVSLSAQGIDLSQQASRDLAYKRALPGLPTAVPDAGALSRDAALLMCYGELGQWYLGARTFPLNQGSGGALARIEGDNTSRFDIGHGDPLMQIVSIPEAKPSLFGPVTLENNITCPGFWFAERYGERPYPLSHIAGDWQGALLQSTNNDQQNYHQIEGVKCSGNLLFSALNRSLNFDNPRGDLDNCYAIGNILTTTPEMTEPPGFVFPQISVVQRYAGEVPGITIVGNHHGGLRDETGATGIVDARNNIDTLNPAGLDDAYAGFGAGGNMTLAAIQAAFTAAGADADMRAILRAGVEPDSQAAYEPPTRLILDLAATPWAGTCDALSAAGVSVEYPGPVAETPLITVASASSQGVAIWCRQGEVRLLDTDGVTELRGYEADAVVATTGQRVQFRYIPTEVGETGVQLRWGLGGSATWTVTATESPSIVWQMLSPVGVTLHDVEVNTRTPDVDPNSWGSPVYLSTSTLRTRDQANTAWVTVMRGNVNAGMFGLAEASACVVDTSRQDYTIRGTWMANTSFADDEILVGVRSDGTTDNGEWIGFKRGAIVRRSVSGGTTTTTTLLSRTPVAASTDRRYFEVAVAGSDITVFEGASEDGSDKVEIGTFTTAATGTHFGWGTEDNESANGVVDIEVLVDPAPAPGTTLWADSWAGDASGTAIEDTTPDTGSALTAALFTTAGSPPTGIVVNTSGSVVVQTSGPNAVLKDGRWHRISTVDIGQPNYRVTGEFTTGVSNTTYVLAVIRYVDTDNFAFIRCGRGTFVVEAVVAGVRSFPVVWTVPPAPSIGLATTASFDITVNGAAVSGNLTVASTDYAASGTLNAALVGSVVGVGTYNLTNPSPDWTNGPSLNALTFAAV